MIATIPTVFEQRLTVTLGEAAQLLGVNEKTARRESNAGKLKTVKIRGRRMVRMTDLQTYLNSLSGGEVE